MTKRTEETIDELLARATAEARAHNAHILQSVAKGIENKRVLHAVLLGAVQSYADFMRVTYGPQVAAEMFYILADDIINKSKPDELPPPTMPKPAYRRRGWGSWFR